MLFIHWKVNEIEYRKTLGILEPLQVVQPSYQQSFEPLIQTDPTAFCLTCLTFFSSHILLLHNPYFSLHISSTGSISSIFLISSSIFYSPFLSNPFFSFSSSSTPSPSFFLISWGTVCEWAVNCLPSQFKPNSHGSWADYLPRQQGKGARDKNRSFSSDSEHCRSVHQQSHIH